MPGGKLWVMATDFSTISGSRACLGSANRHHLFHHGAGKGRPGIGIDFSGGLANAGGERRIGRQ